MSNNNDNEVMPLHAQKSAKKPPKFQEVEEETVNLKKERKEKKIKKTETIVKRKAIIQPIKTEEYVQSTIRLPKKNIMKIKELAFKNELNLYEVVEQLLLYGLEQGIEPVKFRVDKINKNYNVRKDIKDEVFTYLNNVYSIGDFLSTVIYQTGGKVNVYK